MYNFFNTIPKKEANIYYLVWLLNKNREDEPEYFEKAKYFIEKCYFCYGLASCQNEISRIEVVFYDMKEIHCMVNDNLLVIRVNISDTLYGIMSNARIDSSFIHDNEIEKLMEKYQAKNKILIFLETEYVGNVLQIEKNTVYSVFDLYTYVDFLLTGNKCENNQIANEFSANMDELVKSYISYNKIKYDKWKLDQHKGFFKDLQFHLKNGEGKYNSEFGNMWYFDVFETEINDVLIYFRLQHNTNIVTVRACFNSVSDKKVNRKKLLQEVTTCTDTLKLPFKVQTQSGRSKCTTLGSFVDPVIILDKDGCIDRTKTLNKLKSFKKLIDGLPNIDK